MIDRQEFTTKTKMAAITRAEWRCEHCLKDFRSSRLKGRPQYDHKQPCCDGGDNSLDNCQVLCERCHSEKTGKKDVPNLRKSQRLERREAGIEKQKTPWASRPFNQNFKPNERQVYGDIS
jgi:5-methylcytosine-specific restriction enzyme A